MWKMASDVTTHPEQTGENSGVSASRGCGRWPQLLPPTEGRQERTLECQAVGDGCKKVASAATPSSRHAGRGVESGSSCYHPLRADRRELGSVRQEGM